MQDDFYGMRWMLATPFMADEQVDTASIPRLVEKARETRCTGVVALGVTGEVARLTDRERTLVAQTVLDASDGLPVTLGTTASGTQVAIERSRRLRTWALRRSWFLRRRCRSRTWTPFLATISASRTPSTCPSLCRTTRRPRVSACPRPSSRGWPETVPSARYLKLEDPADAGRKSRRYAISSATAWGFFGGLGGVFLLDELARGSIGAMTGFAYPEILVEVCRHMAEGDRRKAEEVFYRHLPLIQFEGQEGIGLSIRKGCPFTIAGLISTPTVRHPGGRAADKTRRELLDLIETLGL